MLESGLFESIPLRIVNARLGPLAVEMHGKLKPNSGVCWLLVQVLVVGVRIFYQEANHNVYLALHVPPTPQRTM